jgi:hypothetical protein
MTKKRRVIRPGLNLSIEQQRAVAQYQRDYQKVHPLIMEAQAAAQRIWQELLNAPQWRIAESVPPQYIKDQLKPEHWTVGHAQVNYVDHIEREGDEAEGNSS